MNEKINLFSKIEYHPLLNQTDLASFCRKNAIVFQAYSSLGTSDANSANKLIQNEIIKEIAVKSKRTPAQVLLRWALQKGACMQNIFQSIT